MEAILKGQYERLHRLVADPDDYTKVVESYHAATDEPFKFTETLINYGGVAPIYSQAPLYEYIVLVDATKPVNIFNFARISGFVNTADDKLDIDKSNALIETYLPSGDFDTSDFQFGMFYEVASVPGTLASKSYDYDILSGSTAVTGPWAELPTTQGDSFGMHSSLCGNFFCIKTVGQALELYVNKFEDDTDVVVEVYKKTLITGVTA